MKPFTELFCELDRTTRTNEKVAALKRYFAQAPPADAAWALQFLCGRRLRRAVSTKRLRQWLASEIKLPEWLIDECYDVVGDLAETLALLQPNEGTGSNLTLSQLVEQRLLRLPHLPDHAKRGLLVQTWRELASNERIVWNKLITGDFRVGAAQTLVVRALAALAGIEPAVMAHRVMGKWQPTAADFQRLITPEAENAAIATPYPFFLASPLETRLRRGDSPEDLGAIADWQVEWKWDGIRAQLIRRQGHTLIWTRGDELVTESFPEIMEAGEHLPDGTVLDGEIVAWRGSSPLPFAALQRRLGRKVVEAAAREQFPVAFVAYDLLERHRADMRGRPLAERRAELERVVAAFTNLAPSALQASSPLLPGFAEALGEKQQPIIRLSPVISAKSWVEISDLHREARDHGVEGLVLKRTNSTYGVGCLRGDWWKWKVDPYVIDAILVAAQRGHGRRASLYTDYTFAVWSNGQLTPVAKAYSGLTDEEIMRVDSFVRQNTTETFGPVRLLKPLQVFELAFEGIQKSARHKSGVAVRFPRISRWRHDKHPQEADTLETLLALAAER